MGILPTLSIKEWLWRSFKIGKTRVITSRVANLVQCCKVNPQSIVVVTFTNKAAREMKDRVVQLLGEDHANRINMGMS